MRDFKKLIPEARPDCLDNCPQIIAAACPAEKSSSQITDLARASRIGSVCITGPLTTEVTVSETQHTFTGCASPWRETDANGNEIVHHAVDPQ